jgi:hypothetical protein
MSSNVKRFVSTVMQENEMGDEAVIGMLLSRNISADAVFDTSEAAGEHSGELSQPLLHIAVHMQRGAIVCALAALGANLEAWAAANLAFLPTARMRPAVQTAVGRAIMRGDLQMLMVLHELGAGMALVRKVVLHGEPKRLVAELSALLCAVYRCRVDVVAYLLTIACVDPNEGKLFGRVFALVNLVQYGAPAKDIIRQLLEHGFDVKKMDSEFARNSSTADFTLSEVVLQHACISGDSELILYLLQDVGLLMRAGILERIRLNTGATETTVEGASWRSDGELLTLEERSIFMKGLKFLESRSCAACGTIGEAFVCSQCQKVRYCSIQCQSRHWQSCHERECAGKHVDAGLTS